ncbi:MAG: glycosyltransferase family 2 protein [Clostridia bacterium]|nr:glycosyltransferase family 2 protein [Clostridia bacterium]
MKISLIVPCYNEQEALPLFFDEVTKVMKSLSCDYEILFINDGSKDNTLNLLKDFAKCDNHITYISFARNFGKEAAMYAGFCNVSGDYVTVIDADMQHPPSLIPKMLSILQNKEYDSVAARRNTREGEPRLRSLFAKLFYKIINKISDADVVGGATDFRLMKRKMVDAIVAMSEYNRFSKGIFGWIGFKTYWLPYENIERIAGQTKWNFWNLFKYSIDGIVNFSQMPLSIASLLGVSITGISFLFVAFIIIRKLIWGDPVTGWASTMSVLLFIGGMILLCLGIIGQYIAKIYLEVKNRPHYIISESNNDKVIKIK